MKAKLLFGENLSIKVQAIATYDLIDCKVHAYKDYGAITPLTKTQYQITATLVAPNQKFLYEWYFNNSCLSGSLIVDVAYPGETIKKSICFTDAQLISLKEHYEMNEKQRLLQITFNASELSTSHGNLTPGDTVNQKTRTVYLKMSDFTSDVFNSDVNKVYEIQSYSLNLAHALKTDGMPYEQNKRELILIEIKNPQDDNMRQELYALAGNAKKCKLSIVFNQENDVANGNMFKKVENGISIDGYIVSMDEIFSTSDLEDGRVPIILAVLPNSINIRANGNDTSIAYI